MKIALFRHHAHDPLSFAICALTRGQYVHAALLVDETNGIIIEAYYPTVRKRALLPAELDGIDLFTVAGMTPDQEKGVLDYAEAAVAAHTKYSIEGLFRFLAPVRALLGEGADSPLANAPCFCSEFAFKAVRYGGGITLLNAHSQDVDPSHLAWSPLLAPVGHG